MRIVILLFSLFLLSGCYLANGSPSSYIFWESPPNMTKEKDKKISVNCYEDARNSLNDIQKNYLIKVVLLGKMYMQIKMNIKYLKKLLICIKNIFSNVFIIRAIVLDLL
ncbi:hypothetical protein [Gallibacterium anatis]|uniref:hypothetical protein n=1 Tax=Gallibacterium anatis TaxID=750 RepID=UPI0039FC91D0